MLFETDSSIGLREASYIDTIPCHRSAVRRYPLAALIRSPVRRRLPERFLIARAQSRLVHRLFQPADFGEARPTIGSM